MPNTANGWPYPTATMTPDVPRDIKAIADEADKRVPKAAWTGSVAVPVTNAATGSVAVTFPVGRFAAAPNVVVSTSGTSFWCAFTSSVTASGFTATVRHIDGTVTTSATPTVAYSATVN